MPPLKLPQITNPWLALLALVLSCSYAALSDAQEDGNYDWNLIWDLGKTIPVILWYGKSTFAAGGACWIGLASPFRQNTATATVSVDIPDTKEKA